MKPVLTLVLALGLAACDTAMAPADPAANASADTPDTLPTPVASAKALSKEIPDSFQGKWDSDRMACSQDVSEMRLIVAADGLRFYESVARVDAVAQPEPNRIEIDAALDAEGMTQGRHLTLTLRDDGMLATTTDGATAIRIRCESGAAQ
ncbi:hypothetical protein ACPVPU_07760 [Sphingomonas sp. CJ99]